MNNLYRYLKLPFEIKRPDALLEVTYSHPFNEENITEKYGYFDEQMEEFVAMCGAGLDEVEAFYTSPGQSIPIHHDGDRLCKINISYGVDGGVIRWYDATKSFKEQPHISDDQRMYDGLVEYANIEDCVKIGEANTNKPTLVNTGVWHDTYNPEDAPGRWTICFKPQIGNKPISWETGLRLFADFFEGEE